MNTSRVTKIIGFVLIAVALLGSFAGVVRAMQPSELFAKVGGASGPAAPTQDPSVVPTMEATEATEVVKKQNHVSGVVTAIDATSITVDGKTAAITDQTHIVAGIVVGDRVQFEALLQPDGSLVAIEVHKIGPKPSGTPEVKPTDPAKTTEVDDDQDQPGVTETTEENEDHSKPGVTRTPEPKETDQHDVKPSVSPEPKETEQEHIKPSVSPEPKETEQPHVKPSASPEPTDAATQPAPKGENHNGGGNQSGDKSSSKHGHK